jgi:hypothetical protein
LRLIGTIDAALRQLSPFAFYLALFIEGRLVRAKAWRRANILFERRRALISAVDDKAFFDRRGHCSITCERSRVICVYSFVGCRNSSSPFKAASDRRYGHSRAGISTIMPVFISSDVAMMRPSRSASHRSFRSFAALQLLVCERRVRL